MMSTRRVGATVGWPPADGIEGGPTMIRDSATFLPTRDRLHCRTAEDPYQVAWEAATSLPVPQAIAQVADRCGLPLSEASLLVFCELSEDRPVAP